MATPSEDDLVGNMLLGKLTAADRLRLVPHMMVFDLKDGDIIHEAGQEVVETWFPCRSAMAAFCVSTDDGSDAVEVALVGREGALGGIVSNGSLPAFATSQVRLPGRFLRIKTSALELAKLDSITLRHWFSRYSDCLLAQVFQTAACNATHTIAQRTAKWLLTVVSRVEGNEIELTQSQLAEMLGVGRTFVTRTMHRFRADGLISTRRGVIVIERETALRQVSCRCTAAIEDHFDTVLHGIYPAS